MVPKYADSYVFPAIIEKGDKNYSVYFPDLPGCASSGRTVEEAIGEAREALAFHLWGMEQDGEAIPRSSSFDAVREEAGENTLAYIDVDMFPIRSRMNSRPVKKTLTIPWYLNELAEKERINFSQLLQSALKERLGL